jgi:hypothetical protein
MIRCMIPVVLILSILGPLSPLGVGTSYGFEPADRILLESYARDTWKSLDAMASGGVLPSDALCRAGGEWTSAGYTSPTDIAAYLWSTLAAERLGLITREDAGRRLARTLEAVGRLERSHDFFYNWYDARTGERLKTWPGPGGGALRPFLSSVDNGWLAAALMMVENARPELRDAVEALLSPMDFAFFYDPFDASDPVAHPGLIRGGFWPDDGSYASFHYGMLNTEPRIVSYVAIARGQIPRDHYFRMSRVAPETVAPTREYLGVPVAEGSVTYRGMRIVPSWDGTMFEALMVPLFVPEAAWAPSSWGVNHPLYVRAQIEYGRRDAKLGSWGISASCDPAGGYKAFGVPALGVAAFPSPAASVVTPHASFLALPFAPREVLANLRDLADRFPTLYGPYGFYDAVDVRSGQVCEHVLTLDQGMILAAIVNALHDGALQHAFSDGKVEEVIHPLIEVERFDVGVGPSSRRLVDAIGRGREAGNLPGGVGRHHFPELSLAFVPPPAPRTVVRVQPSGGNGGD